jgi:hypothetical protein
MVRVDQRRQVYGIGKNCMGVLGLGGFRDESCTLTRCQGAASKPVRVGESPTQEEIHPLENVRLVDGCGTAALVIDRDGRLWVTGDLVWGLSGCFRPVRLDEPEPVVSAAINHRNLVWVTQSGRLYDCGENAASVLGFASPPLRSSVDVADITEWLPTDDEEQPAGEQEKKERRDKKVVVQVRMFQSYTIALLEDGP